MSLTSHATSTALTANTLSHGCARASCTSVHHGTPVLEISSRTTLGHWRKVRALLGLLAVAGIVLGACAKAPGRPTGSSRLRHGPLGYLAVYSRALYWMQIRPSGRLSQNGPRGAVVATQAQVAASTVSISRQPAGEGGIVLTLVLVEPAMAAQERDGFPGCALFATTGRVHGNWIEFNLRSQLLAPRTLVLSPSARATFSQDYLPPGTGFALTRREKPRHAPGHDAVWLTAEGGWPPGFLYWGDTGARMHVPDWGMGSGHLGRQDLTLFLHSEHKAGRFEPLTHRNAMPMTFRDATIEKFRRDLQASLRTWATERYGQSGEAAQGPIPRDPLKGCEVGSSASGTSGQGRRGGQAPAGTPPLPTAGLRRRARR